MEMPISSKTTAHFVCSDAQKTRARFKGVSDIDAKSRS